MNVTNNVSTAMHLVLKSKITKRDDIIVLEMEYNRQCRNYKISGTPGVAVVLQQLISITTQ